MFVETRRTSKGLMLKKFQSLVDEKFAFLRSGRLYLAISGGKDSMTLSALLKESGIKHVLLHCNFQLRGKESDQDEQFLLDYAAKNELEIHIRKFNTSQLAETEKLSIQECARKLRYEWFGTFLDQHEDAYLLTAHHLDDSIETFFINLLRGTGFRGLSGIPVNENRLVRPLSDFTAEEIYHYLDEKQLDYRSDSSNAKRDYLRNKIRHELIPVLADMEPHFRQKMEALFGELTDLKGYISNQIGAYQQRQQTLGIGDGNYQLEALKGCHPFFLEQLFRPYGVHRKNAPEFLKFLHASSGAQFRTQAFHFLIDRENLKIAPHVENSGSVYLEINELSHKLPLEEINVELKRTRQQIPAPVLKTMQQLDAAKVHFPLVIRTWQPGDKMKPLGMTGNKLISDILIDKKINRFDKMHQLVLLDANGRIINLLGLVVSEEVKIDNSTVETIDITRLR